MTPLSSAVGVPALGRALCFGAGGSGNTSDSERSVRLVSYCAQQACDVGPSFHLFSYNKTENQSDRVTYTARKCLSQELNMKRLELENTVRMRPKYSDFEPC